MQVSPLNSLRVSQELLGCPRRSQEVIGCPRMSQFPCRIVELQIKSVAIQVLPLNSLRGSQELLGGPRKSSGVLGGHRRSQLYCRIIGNSDQKPSNSSFIFKLLEGVIGAPRNSQEVLGGPRRSEEVLVSLQNLRKFKAKAQQFKFHL